MGGWIVQITELLSSTTKTDLLRIRQAATQLSICKRAGKRGATPCDPARISLATGRLLLLPNEKGVLWPELFCAAHADVASADNSGQTPTDIKGLMDHLKARETAIDEAEREARAVEERERKERQQRERAEREEREQREREAREEQERCATQRRLVKAFLRRFVPFWITESREEDFDRLLKGEWADGVTCSTRHDAEPTHVIAMPDVEVHDDAFTLRLVCSDCLEIAETLLPDDLQGGTAAFPYPALRSFVQEWYDELMAERERRLATRLRDCYRMITIALGQVLTDEELDGRLADMPADRKAKLIARVEAMQQEG